MKRSFELGKLGSIAIGFAAIAVIAAAVFWVYREVDPSITVPVLCWVVVNGIITAVRCRWSAYKEDRFEYWLSGAGVLLATLVMATFFLSSLQKWEMSREELNSLLVLLACAVILAGTVVSLIQFYRSCLAPDSYHDSEYADLS